MAYGLIVEFHLEDGFLRRGTIVDSSGDGRYSYIRTRSRKIVRVLSAAVREVQFRSTVTGREELGKRPKRLPGSPSCI